MKRSLYVISDLHLGGAEGYQMCAAAGRERLVAFIRHLVARSKATPVHLLLNGDVVDFLAEKEFASFTNDDHAATEKLARIIDSTRPVWDALSDFARSGARLTLLLGNHDVELSFPGPRALLARTLGGPVDFIYDNAAFTDGDVLVEHGNRYDHWNVVSHDKLRETRSALSRREPSPTDYLGPPGSQLVQKVMTPLKQNYPWIDLLKPEGEGMFPVLAAIKPSAMREAPQFLRYAASAQRVQFNDKGAPIDPQNVAAVAAANVRPGMSPALREALDIAGLLDPGNVAGGQDDRDLLTRFKEGVSGAVRNAKIGLLTRALRFFARDNNNAFDTRLEQADYLRAARASADNGFKVIVYGHTHLPKQIDLDGGARYLNTGTWADLMTFPAAIFLDDEDAARAQVDAFVDDLMAGRIDQWRRQVPTFAQIDFEDDSVTAANVHIFESADSTPVLKAGRLDILAR